MKSFDFSVRKSRILAFTLVEMLMALLIVSIILTASLPIITTRQKAFASVNNQHHSFPIGGIIVWYHQNLPDSTWLECNGQKIPDGIEYESARKVFGTNLPNFQGMFLRGAGMQTLSNLGAYWNGLSFGTGSVGSMQGDTIRNIYGQLYGHNIAKYGISSNGALQWLTADGYGNAGWDGGNPGYAIVFNASLVTPVTNEIRPVNIAVKYIAKVRY